MFFFLKNFYKKKRISFFLSTKKQHKNIIKKFFKKINFFYDYKWKRGSITNFNEVSSNIKKKPDIIYIVDPVKNISVVREAAKKKIKTIIFGDSHYIYKNYDYFIPMNDDSENSLIFILKQIYLLFKKIEISKYYKNNKKYFFFKLKNLIVKFFFTSDLFTKKKYFYYKINKIIKYFKYHKINKIRKEIKFISNLYNEKIIIKGFIKFNNKNILIHDNKMVCVSNIKKTFLMLHILANTRNIFNYFFKEKLFFYNSNLKRYIKREKNKIIIKLIR